MTSSSIFCAVGAVLVLNVGASAPSFRTPAPISAQEASGCRPADTDRVPTHLAYFKAKLANTDSAAIKFRNMFLLDAVAANKVTLVTKSTTCVSGATAVNTVRGEPGTNRQVWVYALGNNFAVEDPEIPTPPLGEYPIYFFDKNWVLKSVLKR
jgi:hypothetical protein